MDTTEIIAMIRQTMEEYLKGNGSNISPIAIYPFGKDGLLVKHILNNQFGITEKYLVDNKLCYYNPSVISAKELLEKKEDIVVIISTVSEAANEVILNELKNKDSIRYINITDPIIWHKNDGGDYYKTLKDLLIPKVVLGHSLLRVGRFHDGGYIMLDDFSKDMIAYSFGISDDMSWDMNISDMTGMTVNMFDHTIPCAPQYHKGCVFNRIGLGVSDDEDHNLLSLKTILSGNNDLNTGGNLIMKMDIEGAEWDVLESADESVIDCFCQMVFEFHGMTDETGREKRINVFKKLKKTHELAWIHGNNYTHAVECNGIVMPYAIETLFLNKKLYEFDDCRQVSFQTLDMPNMRGRKDFDLSSLLKG